MLKLEKINDRNLLHIEPLQKDHILDIKALWNIQYTGMVEKHGFLPKKWLDDMAIFANFIEQHIDSRNGIVAMFREKVVGFLAYSVFNFHNEKTAYIPVMAHAAEATYKLTIYSMMYAHVSQKFVDQGCLNQLCTFFSQDHALQEYLYEVGFGLYVVDAYRGTDLIPAEVRDPDFVVREAGTSDVDACFALVNESARYYAQTPLFLKREDEEIDQVVALITSPDSKVFLAVKNDQLIGFMNIRCNHTDDAITLCDTTTACIDPLGAYIKPEYRGLGVGKTLLRESIAWIGQQGITNVHVDFESANYHANQFWPNYFTPVLYSVKRRLNNDVIIEKQS